MKSYRVINRLEIGLQLKILELTYTINSTNRECINNSVVFIRSVQINQISTKTNPFLEWTNSNNMKKTVPWYNVLLCAIHIYYIFIR